MEPRSLTMLRNTKDRKTCLGNWLSPCLGRGREGGEAPLDWDAIGVQAGEGIRSGSREILPGIHYRQASLQHARMAAAPFGMRDGRTGSQGPSGSNMFGGQVRMCPGSGAPRAILPNYISEREMHEIAEWENGRDDRVDRWQSGQGMGNLARYLQRISKETRSRPHGGVSESKDVHRDLLIGQSPRARCQRSARHVDLCSKDEEQRCSLILEKVKAMRHQLGEDLKKNQNVLRTRQMGMEGACGTVDADSFCHSILSSIAKEPEIPKDLEVMIKDCFKSCIGVHNKECMVCTRSFTAKDLLTCKTSNRCRHSLYPCGHSVLCGDCALVLWQTTRKCPMCRSLMTKRPKVFKPGRWQMVGPHKE